MIVMIVNLLVIGSVICLPAFDYYMYDELKMNPNADLEYTTPPETNSAITTFTAEKQTTAPNTSPEPTTTSSTQSIPHYYTTDNLKVYYGRTPERGIDFGIKNRNESTETTTTMQEIQDLYPRPTLKMSTKQAQTNTYQDTTYFSPTLQTLTQTTSSRYENKLDYKRLYSFSNPKVPLGKNDKYQYLPPFVQKDALKTGHPVFIYVPRPKLENFLSKFDNFSQNIEPKLRNFIDHVNINVTGAKQTGFYANEHGFIQSIYV